MWSIPLRYVSILVRIETSGARFERIWLILEGKHWKFVYIYIYTHCIYTFHIYIYTFHIYIYIYLPRGQLKHATCILEHFLCTSMYIYIYMYKGYGYSFPQESWELHDAVEVGGGDLEERGDVGAFDQVRVGIVEMDRKIYIYTLYWFMNIWIVGIGKTVSWKIKLLKLSNS